MKNEVFIQSPVRIDFSGGTLDCWPINVLLSPVVTINGAVNLYTSCRIQRREDQRIIIESGTNHESYKFSSLEELLKYKTSLKYNNQNFRFFREIIAYRKPNYGFHLSTQSQSPMGGGLGGSSSLCVSIFKAFFAMDDSSCDDHKLVRICSEVETRILNKPTGTQDYFPPLKGGVNIINYHLGETGIEHLPANKLDINRNISLFFTGKSHHSGINNWEVIKKFVDGDKSTIKALEIIKRVAEKTRNVFLKSDWQALPELFKEEFEARKNLSESFLSPEIEKLDKVTQSQGADGIHICGAGGGGCVFVWSRPEKKNQIIRACVQAGFKHLDVTLV